MFTNLTHFAHPANSSLVLGVILGPVEGTFFVRRSTVNRCMASRANFKLCELIKLDIDTVVRAPFALCFSPSGLGACVCQSNRLLSSVCSCQVKLTFSIIFEEPPLAMIRLAKLNAEL